MTGSCRFSNGKNVTACPLTRQNRWSSLEIGDARTIPSGPVGPGPDPTAGAATDSVPRLCPISHIGTSVHSGKRIDIAAIHNFYPARLQDN